ncbi:MAG TPA: TPM domain-containing protein [Candidatus Nanoarchaeia archaeon]|nr:TPM domain-containing protein [Candidatus Nanoarchaeia archaeon]
MRRLFCFLLILGLLLPIVNAEKPEDVKLNGLVNDYANVIDDGSKLQINSLLQKIYDNGTAQIAVVTVRNINGEDIEGFAIKVAEGKLGNTEKDNGLLLLISVEDRAWRFEVGRGLEPWLNDAKVGRIARNQLVPALKNGEYGVGILNSVNEIEKELSGVPSENNIGFGNAKIAIIFFVIALIIFLVIIYISYKTRVKVKRGKHHDKAFFAGFLASQMMRGRGFNPGSGGNFGGFGGGNFGGGGASGGY